MRDKGNRTRRLGEYGVAASTSTSLVYHNPSQCASHMRLLRYRNSGRYTYSNYYSPFPHEDEAKFIGVVPWIMRFLRLVAVGLGLLSSSLTLYGILYWVVMPGRYASRPLFFDYTGTVPNPHRNITIDPAVRRESTKTSWAASATAPTSSTSSTCSTTASLSSETTCISTPWATVDLFSKEQAVTWGEATHRDLVPPPLIEDRLLKARQAYYVEVHLTLPETELNRHIGIFGVAVDLLSHPCANGPSLKLASSLRSSRLPNESGWLAVARKIFWMVPLIFGGMAENQVVIVPSFRHIVESKEYPLVSFPSVVSGL